MRHPAGLIAIGAAAVLAGAPALAQAPAADPIDALLKQQAAGSSAVDASLVVPATPRPYVPPPPRLTEPTFIHETGKAPDGPPSPSAQAYDDRLHASATAMRGAFGPLEGGWTLSVGGRALYSLELADRGGYVEGAWRDLLRPGALEGSGFIEDSPRRGGDVTLRFGAVVAVLRPEGGRWAGQLTEAGRSEPATLVRRGP